MVTYVISVKLEIIKIHTIKLDKFSWYLIINFKQPRKNKLSLMSLTDNGENWGSPSQDSPKKTEMRISYRFKV